MDEHTLSKIITALDGFLFTPEEYAPDDGITLTRKAVRHVRNAIPSIRCKPIEYMVSLLVKARCLSLMALEVSWERLPCGKGSSLIACTINGCTFKGKACIHPKEVRVEIEGDGNKTSGTCTLHKWSPEVFTKEPFPGSIPNAEGLRCAKEIFMWLCYKRLARR